jgi:WD40 repeat protein
MLLIWYKYFVCLWDIEAKRYLSRHYCGSKYKPWGTVFMDEYNHVEVCEFPFKIDPNEMAHAVSPDNQLLAVHAGKKLVIYKIKDRSLISSRDIEYEFDGISSKLRFSSDSQYIVFSNRDMVSVWDMISESPVLVYDGLERVEVAGLCSDSELFYFSSKERIIIREHKPLQVLIDSMRRKFIGAG